MCSIGKKLKVKKVEATMIHQFPSVQQARGVAARLRGCEHRSVSKDGRIICAKISQGDPTVLTETCRSCPAQGVDCSHLRFSLNHSPHVPLVVRWNGHTEIWSDDAPELCFCNAACAARVAPVLHPKACAGCPLRAPVQAVVDRPLPIRQASGHGKVVAFPARESEPALATG
jgi:hypothetical protein